MRNRNVLTIMKIIYFFPLLHIHEMTKNTIRCDVTAHFISLLQCCFVLVLLSPGTHYMQ